MDWIEKLNGSIAYIENNLENTINFNEAAKIACCSTFQFQRMFSYIAGVTLSEYIRRRRMTKAAFELQNSNIKILDLSAKYGYDSPTSFTRAFQSIHDMPPSAARHKGITLKNYPKLVFSITIKGDKEMQYRIEEKEKIRIVGIRKKIELNMENNFLTVPKFWQKTLNSHLFSEISKMMNQPPYGILGVTAYKNSEEYYHYVAVSTDKPIFNNMVEYELPAGTWAIFECTGSFPDSIQELYRRFYTEWLPFSGYEYQMQDIEVYPMINQQSDKAEVWFSIR